MSKAIDWIHFAEPQGLPNETDAKEALEVALKALKYVKKQIGK